MQFSCSCHNSMGNMANIGDVTLFCNQQVVGSSPTSGSAMEARKYILYGLFLFINELNGRNLKIQRIKELRQSEWGFLGLGGLFGF